MDGRGTTIAGAARMLAAALLLALPSPASPEEIDRGIEYARCMDLARTDPAAGFDRALALAGLGGGAEAAHCAAVALIGLGQPREAAQRLESLAQSVRAEADLKAELLGQATQAWMLAGDAARAYATASAAIEIAPEEPDLLIDRAQAAADLGRAGDALLDLDRALALAPARIEAMVFRASALRRLQRLEEAAAAIERAVQLAPDFAEGLLEAGNIRGLKGDAAGARQAWVRAVQAAPDGTAARAARANLEALDIKPAR